MVSHGLGHRSSLAIHLSKMVLQKENIATLLKLHVPCSYIPIHLLIVGVTFLLVI